MALAELGEGTAPVDPVPVSVAARVKRILDAFELDPHGCGFGLTDLTEGTRLPKATVHRLCGELVTCGLLDKHGSRYHLGGALFELGQRVSRVSLFRDAALPYMEDLFVATGETVHFAVPDGIHVLYVEKIMGHRGVDAPSRVGGRLPMSCTASGKAILAFSEPSVLQAVERAGLATPTPRAPRTGLELRRELGLIRRHGIAIEHEQARIGFTSIAAPVIGRRDRVLGALAIAAAVGRRDDSSWSALLRGAASALGTKLRSAPL